MPNLENKVVTHITLYADASTQNRPPYVYAKQYDANSRYLVVRIVDSNKDIAVTGAAQLNATKPDGTHSYIAGTANEDGTVTIGLTANLLAVEGKVSCDITVFDSADGGSSLLTTSTFFILVDESNYDSDAIESTDEFSTVSDALTKIAADRAAAESARDEAVSAAEEAQTALATKADGLVLDGNKLQLVSGTTPLGAVIELPTGVSDLAVFNGKLYLLTDDGERIGGGVAPPQQVDGFILEREGDENKLFLSYQGVTIGEGVVLPATGGGGGATSILKLMNEGDSSYTVSAGTEVKLKFNFTSVESDMITGNGTAKVIVNGATKATLSIPQGHNEIDITGYLSAGENTVKLTVTDVYGLSRSLIYSVNVIALSITSTFDDSEKFSGEITFKYTPTGLLDKTVYFEIDGEEYTTVDIAASGKQRTIIFPAMSHGSHKLVVYCKAELNGTTITSNRLVYDIICIEDGATGTVISMPFEGGNFTAGDLISVPYTVYNPSSLTADALITLVSDSGESLEYTYNVDRTKQTFTTREQPVGNVTLTISCNGATKSALMTVAELKLDVEAVTNDLELHLTSKGRSNSEYDPDVWTHGSITTAFSGFNWIDNGWVKNDNGDTVLRLSGDARAVVGFTPFATDARQYGRTLELEYSVSDVANRDAIVISCLADGKGFEATADKAYIKSEVSTVNCRYAEDNRVRVTFVIEARSEYRLLSIYLNGILSGAIQYPDNDNFQQTTPVQISIGSNDCSVDIYTMRSYSTALSMDEIRDNLIADTADINEKLRLYQENDIYDSYQQLSYDKLVKKLPSLLITGALPTAKGDKKNVAVQYIDPDESSLDFTDTATIDVQGTSSQYYIRKNWKIKTSNEHKPALDQLPAKVFCTKADYAEATGTHNTGIANFVHTLYDVKTPPQEVDPKIRTTIYGHPCVIFHKENEESPPVFIGKYNFNYDKGAENVFGFSKNYPACECWEFCNNTAPTCLFHRAIGNSFGKDFEARYPEGKTESAAFRRVQAWVASTYQGAATSEALAQPYTDCDGKTHTHDTRSYRLAKFKTEFEDYFDPDFACMYYVFTHVMLMADQRAKNMFLTTWDGVIWQPWFYDNDTCLGINNVGQLLYDYWHEDTDQLDGADIYSGQTSALWNNYREAFPDKIEELYCSLRSSGKLTAEKIYDTFITNHADKWSISVYNEDADYKYVSMLRDSNDASNLGQIKGKGAEHLGYFVTNRLKYFDSKYYAPDYANNYISLRLYTPTEWAGVEPNANITVTPYSNMYAGVRYNANGELQQIRATKNVPVTFEAPDETFTFTETAIYGASEISSIGDLSPLYAGFVKVDMATKLTELIIGSGVEGYVNYNLTEVTVGTNKLLRKIDVRNCPNLVNPLDVSGCPNIEEIYCEGTGVTGVSLPSSGYLRILHLPETVTNLTIRNQNSLTDFTMAGTANLSTLWLENNSEVVKPLEILDGMPEGSRIRIIGGFDVEMTNAELMAFIAKLDSMRGLDENGNNMDNAQVSGTIYIHELTQPQLDAIIEAQKRYPGLVVMYTKITTYTVTFRNYDDTILYTANNVAYGSTVEFVGDTPVKENADEYEDWIFTGWSPEPTNVTADMVCYAQFKNGVAKARLLLARTLKGDYINDRVKKIGKYAFNGCGSLTSIDFPEVASIEDYAFANGNSITSVNLPKTTNLSAGALQSCPLTGTQTFPSVTQMGTYAVSGYKTTRLIFSALKTMAYYSFSSGTTDFLDFPVVTGFSSNSGQGCTVNRGLIIRTETIPSVYGPPSIPTIKGYIYVPSALVDEYKSATNWSAHAEKFRALEDYTVDGTITGELDETKI